MTRRLPTPPLAVTLDNPLEGLSHGQPELDIDDLMDDTETLPLYSPRMSVLSEPPAYSDEATQPAHWQSAQVESAQPAPDLEPAVEPAPVQVEAVPSARVETVPSARVEVAPSARVEMAPSARVEVAPLAQLGAAAPPEHAVPAQFDPALLTTKMFTYEMKNFFNTGKTWATVTIGGDARLSHDTPVFLEGASIRGSVKLDLQHRDPITSIWIFVHGDLVMTSGGESARSMFMNTRHFVWAARSGDPRAPRTPTADKPVSPWTEKLHGKYEFPLVFVTGNPRGSPRRPVPVPALDPHPCPRADVYCLPHTFKDGYSGSIHYGLDLHIERKGKLASDDRLTVPFDFFSMRQPPTSSLLQKLAFQNHAPMPSPREDPQGWHAMTRKPVTVLIRGHVFGDRNVEIKCWCADQLTLDLLASTKTSVLNLYLQRRITWGTVDHVQPCGKAVWWPLKETTIPQDPRRRCLRLMGEIALSGQFAPTSAIHMFSVEYTVILSTVDVVAKRFDSWYRSEQLATQTVEITTRFPAGPRPPQSIAPTQAHTS
uniref:Arrestin-like N-terminal domain-containing protein n=1 Tax=Mycena chlorophos TaxID=658473 RepID=A0ABQ0LXT8_MYCCL|nr:predicted protein [Mycena chlorophos]